MLTNMFTMPSTLIRIPMEYHEFLHELSKKKKVPMQRLIERAFEYLRRNEFLEDVNKDFQTLRNNKKLWKQEEEERLLWESTLLDGLDTKV